MTKEHQICKVKSFQDRLCLASKANSSRTFGILYDKIYRKEVIFEAWQRVKKNRGICGVDNSYDAALKLSNFACQQLRLFWRRRKQCKDIKGVRKWPNDYFYNKGLHYVHNLLR